MGLAYVTDDAHVDMVVGTGPGNVGLVRVFDGVTTTNSPRPWASTPPSVHDTVGVFVAASNDPSGEIYGDFTARVGYTTGPRTSATCWTTRTRTPTTTRSGSTGATRRNRSGGVTSPATTAWVR